MRSVIVKIMVIGIIVGLADIKGMKAQNPIPGDVCGNYQSDQHFEVDFCIPPRTPESPGGN